MSSLGERSIDLARRYGVCDKWSESWGDPDDDEVLERWKDGIAFSVKHQFPPLDFVRSYPNKKKLAKHNIYVDTEYDCDNAPKCIIRGTSKGILRYSHFTIASVSIFDEAELDITLLDSAMVFIYTSGNATVNVRTMNPRAKACVFDYSGCEINAEGNVLIKNKYAK